MRAERERERERPGKGVGGGGGGSERKGGRVMQQEGGKTFWCVCGRVRWEGEEGEQHGAIRVATKSKLHDSVENR